MLIFFFIMISGRLVIYYSSRMSLLTILLFRLAYFLITTAGGVIGIVFYSRVMEDGESCLPDKEFSFFVLMSACISFLISFVLRRWNLRMGRAMRLNRAPLLQPTADYSRIRGPQLKKVEEWIVKYKETEEKDTCAICFDEFKNKEKVAALPECGHLYHTECIKRWIIVKPECPCCKADLSIYFENV
ncbi:unnamed protein product [Blepharisma stoltei]|uniref:RING-type E3 ubiquitin transferase n=1 Tax=Blepharisma stoltei TaxID=1481888 RepID=A0AAU9KHS7_9CILI|nr:unnamed protein product [Blepharisma stoltei]